MKPRLYRRNGTWFCCSLQGIGSGVTPNAAFQHWLKASLARYDFP